MIYGAAVHSRKYSHIAISVHISIQYIDISDGSAVSAVLEQSDVILRGAVDLQICYVKSFAVKTSGKCADGIKPFSGIPVGGLRSIDVTLQYKVRARVFADILESAQIFDNERIVYGSFAV